MDLNRENKFKEKSNLNIYLAGSVVLTSICVTTYVGSNYEIMSSVNHFKNQKQITKDASSLGVDLDASSVREDKLVRFAFPKEGDVYVIYDVNMTQVEKEYIKETVDYYNNIFKNIDGNYSFTLVDSKFSIKETDSYIKFNNKDLEGLDKGLNKSSLSNKLKYGYFISNSEIYINWNKLHDASDTMIRYIFNHEFAHSLGLNDVYIDSHKSFNTNTIMNVFNSYTLDVLYPNDYAILQALYSNSCNNYKRYNEAINEMKNEINEYRNYFYDYYSSIIKNNNPKYGSMNKEYLHSITEIGWNSYQGDYKCSLNIDNDRCTLKVKDGDKIIDSSNGDIYWSNGMYFIENLQIRDASYMINTGFNKPYKFTLVLYMDENNKLSIADSIGEYKSSIQDIKMNKIR